MADRNVIASPGRFPTGRLVIMLAVSLLVSVLFQGCGNAGQMEYKPTSAGKADEVLWVMNDGFWADTVGAAVGHQFMKSYRILPQAEPDYFIRKKNYNQFNNDIIKKYRTIVVVATRDRDIQYPFARSLVEEAGKEYDNIVFLRNVWAQPQSVIVVTADTEAALLDVLANRSHEVTEHIRNSEDKRIHFMLYENGTNEEADAAIRDKYSFEMDIPAEYYIAVENRDFTWLRRENVFLSSNIMIYKRELDTEEIASGVDWPLFARNIREYLGKSYIHSSMEGSYMEIEDRYAPVIQKEIEFLGRTAVETQGLWRMENDFMGGPFLNIAWFDESNNTYYMIDTYVHAPKEGKKKFMRQLEYILSTAALPDNG